MANLSGGKVRETKPHPSSRDNLRRPAIDFSIGASVRFAREANAPYPASP